MYVNNNHSHLRGAIKALIVGCNPSNTLGNALSRLNIRPVGRVCGENVRLLPGAINPGIHMVIIFDDFTSRELARDARRQAERLSIPILRCRASVSALAAAWAAWLGGGTTRAIG